MPTVEVRLDQAAFEGFRRAALDAALETIGAVRTDMVTAQVIPFDTGKLQNSGGAIDQLTDGGEIHTTLCVGDTPYARRLYFHPEYNFQKVNNPNAQGLWASPWLPGGDREQFIPETFRTCLERRLPE
ncbi:MAG: hypothetical protein IJ960_06750 [Oscillospiraceae bacterium]|nr:hypothetical protein [Oscillospiraceae bacterium]